MNKFINEINEVIPLLENDLVDNSLDEQVKKNMGSMLQSYSLKKTIAQYTSGLEKEVITESTLASIDTFERCFKWEGFDKSYGEYDQIVWLLSLAILCEVPDEEFERIVKVLERDKAKDRLIKALVNYRFPNRMGSGATNYTQRSPYAELDMLITGVKQNQEFIKSYLNKKWYSGHDDAPWHDTHKNTKANTHFGYWAWETAALVKVFNINDEKLEDQQYYPYRAVHW